MTALRFLREQLPTGELSLIEFGPGWSYEDALNRPGALHAGVPITSDYATDEVLDPWRTAIYAVRDGVIEWGGLLLPPSLSLGASVLSLDCFGWLGYWDRRLIRKAYAPTDVEQFDIFKRLVDDAQDEGEFGAGFDLGIEVVWGDPSGVPRTRTEDYQVEKVKNLGEALRQLAACEDGFDFAMEYELNTSTDRIDKRIRLSYPRKGRDTGYTFEFERGKETNVIARGFTDPIEFAWNGDGWGSGNEETRLRSAYIDEALRGVYPPYDASPTWSSVIAQTTLDEHTIEAFARSGKPLRLHEFQIDPDKDPRWGDWSTGDVVRAKVTDGYGSTTPVVGDPFRILGWKVQDTGEHFITPGDPNGAAEMTE